MAWIIPLLMVLGIALLIAFLVKKIPILGKIANITVAVFLVGVLFKLGGLSQVSQWVDKVPYLQYIIAIPAGVMLGEFLADVLPIPGM